MSLDPTTLTVCLVTDAAQCADAGRSVAATVADAVRNGVRSVQVRAKDASGAAFLGEVTAVAAAILLRWDARKARSEDMNEDGVADQDIARIGDEEF